MSMPTAALSALAIGACLTACAIPMTQLGTVSLDDVRAEQLKQQQLAIQWDLRQQQRVEDVGHALLAAATPFCNGGVAPRTGIRFANVYSFSREYQPAARALGFSDTLVVVGVARGSAAERAGFTAGDRVVAMDGGSPPSGPNAIQVLTRALDVRRLPAMSLTLQHGETRFLSDTADATPSPATARLAADARAFNTGRHRVRLQPRRPAEGRPQRVGRRHQRRRYIRHAALRCGRRRAGDRTGPRDRA